MKLSPKDRQNAITILNWFQQNADFFELERNNDMPVYFSAMKFFEKVLGNANFVNLEDDDIQCLLKLRSKNKTGRELAEELSLSEKAIQPKMHKLITRGLAYSYLEKKSALKENRKTYYGLTPYGEHKLIEELENM